MSAKSEVKKWLDASRPTSVAELAERLGVKKQHIYRSIGELRRKDNPPKQDDTEALLERCRSGSIPDEAANRILGRIMADGKDADRIKAIDIYDTRNRAMSSRIGPPAPHAPQQIIDRLALMMKAAAPEHIMEAAKQSGYQMVPLQAPQSPPGDPALQGPVDPPEGPVP